MGGIKSTNTKVNPPKRATRPWWEAKKTSDDDGAELARRLFDTVNTLEGAQLSSIQSLLRSWRIYNGREDLNTFTWFGSSQQGFGGGGATLGSFETPHWNLIESALQTQQSRIAADPVKVMAMTDGGNYSEKRKAEQLNKFSDGATEASGARAEGPEVFVDGGWAGTGYLHVFKDNSRTGDWEICAEKVFPAEIMVDEAECLVTNGHPYQFYRRRVISRTKLEADYPKKKALIRMAQTEMIKLNDQYALDEMIVVIEAWHRRSNYRTKDGRHCIAISSGTLEDDPKWDKDHFPFAIYRWKRNSLGFQGKSLVDQTHTIQSAVTKGNYVIDQSLEICGMPYVACEDGSDIVFEHLSGGIGAQVRYSGTPPQLVAPSPVAPEHFQNLEMQVKRFYDISRLSEQSATGEVQSNIKSGEGIRTQQAVESLAWKQTVKDYQNFWIDVVKLHVEVAREIAALQPGFKATTKDGKFLRSVRFLDFDLDTSRYTWTLYPTSLLPDTPEGKFDKVQELIQSGMVQPEQGLYMLDIPDTKSITMYNEAIIRWAEWAIAKILDERVKIVPLPFLGSGLARVIETAQAAYLTAQMEDVGKAQLAMLQTFWQQCLDLQKKQAAAAAMPAGAGPVPAVPTAGAGPAALAPQPGATPQARPMKAPPTPLMPQVANA